jgi:hypothetical protein
MSVLIESNGKSVDFQTEFQKVFNNDDSEEFVDSFTSYSNDEVDKLVQEYKNAITEKKTKRRKKVNRFSNSKSLLGPKCSECDTIMDKNSLKIAYICNKCGNMEELVGNDVNIIKINNSTFTNYNTSNESASPVRVVGPGNYIFQKCLVSSSDYIKTQGKITFSQMRNIIYQYKGPKPPKNVVNAAAKMYHKKVQPHMIKRGDVRLGTMAACLSRKCEIFELTRKPKEMAAIFGISQSDLSKGDKILDELASKGLITTEKFYHNDGDRVDSFLNIYFESLRIPSNPMYRNFVKNLIRFTIKYRIAQSSIISSKCAGAIYIMSACCSNLDISRDEIEEECNISKSTFSRFYQAVFKELNSNEPRTYKMRKRLRHLFHKHNLIY